MYQNFNSLQSVILMPHMGEGKMPDNIPVAEHLKDMGLVPLQPDLSDPEVIRSLPWDKIQVIDLRYMRGSLTNYTLYKQLVYRLHDMIEQEQNKGHQIDIFPKLDAIEWIASKENYTHHINQRGIPTIPTTFIKRHSQEKKPSTEEPDQLQEAVDQTMAEIKKGHKLVLKPAISSLARNIIFISSDANGFLIEIPRLEKESDKFTFSTETELQNFLLRHFEQTTSPDETFLLQKFVPNIEISGVYLNGIPHFVKRTPGEQTDISHHKYGGEDEIITGILEDCTDFFNEIYNSLPDHVRATPFIRLDAMWDIENEQYIFAEIEGAGASRLWIEEADRTKEYATMLKDRIAMPQCPAPANDTAHGPGNPGKNNDFKLS